MSQREAWFARNERAEELEHEGRIGEAIDLYQANAREGCDIVFTHERLAALLRKQERYDEALKALDRAIELESRRGPSERVVRLKERREITAEMASRPRTRTSLPQKGSSDALPRRTKVAGSRKGCMGMILLAFIGLSGLLAVVATIAIHT